MTLAGAMQAGASPGQRYNANDYTTVTHASVWPNVGTIMRWY